MRIPPSVSLRYAEYVAEIAERAFLDYDEQVYTRSDIINHLENRWIEFVLDKKYSTERCQHNLGIAVAAILKLQAK